ncbi:MAG: hypothetical protein LHV69_03580 [Elusimicrobia bacterium]|nr:hypothetical protein [Candidatus Obscuribacterium magneticum]
MKKIVIPAKAGIQKRVKNLDPCFRRGDERRWIPAFAGMMAGLILLSSLLFGADYYVATNGSQSNDGSAAKPWPTINYALGRVAGGDTIIVQDGVYDGGGRYCGTATTRSFDNWVTIKAEHPYQAKLTNIGDGSGGGTVFCIYTPGSAKITVEGFILSNQHPSYVCGDREPYYVVHFQDAQDIIFRNNIVYGNNAPRCCNELLKVNRGGDPYYPKNILIQGNVFYDHPSAGGTDIIDSVRPGELDICDNIFFTRSSPQAQSFITLKTEVLADTLGITPRSPRYNINRNVFLNWDGASDQAFIQLGEDGYAQYMITDALIENNLMIGNSPRPIVAPIQLKGVRNVTVRANTIVGDLPGSSYGFRIGPEASNPQVRDIFIYNNIWSDPTGTMGSRFINNFNDVDVTSILLDNNLFWNAGNALPTQEEPPPGADQNRVVSNPGLPTDQSNIVLPVYDEANHQFLSGYHTIREEFERLAFAYGALPINSPAVSAADRDNMPVDDILGHARDANPDLGAFEYGSTQPPPPGSPPAPGADGTNDFIMNTNVIHPDYGNAVRFTVRTDGRKPVKFDVFNTKGDWIVNLVDGLPPAGSHTVTWDGKNKNGKKVPAGTYLLRGQIGDAGFTAKLSVVK